MYIKVIPFVSSNSSFFKEGSGLSEYICFACDKSDKLYNIHSQPMED